ncbi:MAG: MBL fold metallo-hydrolase [Acidobacteria bacterium]|nr:MAG: MBL fold metallo-hydrolase [Acidobacteriota bacterium]
MGHAQPEVEGREEIMYKKTMAAIVFLTLLVWAASAQDAKTVISNASKAMGADNLKSIEYSAVGADFAFGQAMNPNSPWPKFIDKTYTRAINFETPASRLSRVRMQGEYPQHGGGGQPLIGEQTQNQVIVVNANTPWAQQLEIWMSPHGFLKAASMKSATGKTQSVAGKKYNVVTFMGDNKAAVTGYINEQNMVEKVETLIDNNVLGDMSFEALYSEYKDFGGVKFPTRIVQRQGGFPILDLAVLEVKPNAPANIQPAQAQAGAPPAPTSSQKLGDGVYLILPAYAAVAVDFKDGIVVIEGPQSEERASAIIAEAKKVIPNKPIKYVINTHHHFDHSGGLRTFVAEGATIVTHESNRAYYERIFAIPHTLGPDKLSQAKKKPSFETMTDKKVMTDGNHVIELYQTQGNFHNDGLIIAYLPKEKVLVEADSFNPPPQPNAPAPAVINLNTLNLYDNIQRLKLDVQTIRVTMAELTRAIGRATTP